MKIAAVVDGAGDYDLILGARLQKELYQKIEATHGKIFWEDAHKLLCEKISKYQVPVYGIDSSANILAYGATVNNRKEFDFFSKLLERNGYSEKLVNVRDCEKVVEPLIVTFKRIEEARNVILSVAARFLSLRGYISKSILHQVLNYSLTFLCAIATLVTSKAKVFVVANDHSPMPVAFSVVAKYFGVTTLYIQHAEVTEIFPRNDFDFSILRNQASRNVYEKIAPLTGESIYLSRIDKDLTLGRILHSRQLLREKVDPAIVIYPSSSFVVGELGELVRRLRLGGVPSDVRVKPHPSFSAFEVFDKLNVGVLKEVPEYPHIAICGNSSVVVELLARGNLVYQYFKLDSIVDDYYGFVRRGLTSSLADIDTSGKFWSDDKDGKAWGAVLGEYLPNLDTDRNLIEKRRESLFFRKLFVASGLSREWDHAISKEFSFYRDLFCFNQTFTNFMRAGRAARYGDLWIIKRLNSYFDSRSPLLSKLFNSADLTVCQSILDFWLIAKRIEWTGYPPSHENIALLIEFACNYSGGEGAEKWVEAKIFDIILRHSNNFTLIGFLNRTRHFRVENASINRRIAFLRFAQADQDQGHTLLKYFDYRKADLTPLERLKISVQCLLKVRGEFEFSDYQEVERKFIEYLPAISAEYKLAVINVYDQLRDRVVLLDVKRNSDQFQRFVAMVESKLVSREGFSFIRLSDGEGYLFRDYSEHFSEDDALNRERHWWGQEIPADLREKISNNAKAAIQNADVLGIPSVYRFLRDHSDKSVTLKNSVQGRGLLSVLEGIRMLDRGSAIYTDDKANLAVFNNMQVLRKIAQLAGKVIIVSSGEPNNLKNILGETIDTRLISIPTHNKTLKNDRYTSFEQPLPFLFQNICDAISGLAVAGDLVLVGAGVAGKIFMDTAKSKGAVALDMGSAMDEILGAGIHSLH